jgi:hypothetical protein
MKVLERHLRRIRPGKWGEVEGLDNKYDAVEGAYEFPPKRYYRSFSGPHDVFTSIMEREWESLATMESANEKAFADPQWQALRPEFEAIVESLHIELYWVQFCPMVTITPASKVVQDNYSIQAVPSGANAAQHQVAARIITASPSQQKTVTATGHVHSPGAQAIGSLTFFNGLAIPYTVGAGTVFTDANGVQVTNDEPAAIPPTVGTAPGSVSVPAHAVNPGVAGNIPALDFNFMTCCGSPAVNVSNPSAFTGGQDAKDYMFLQQSDVDRVANPLKDTLLAQAKSNVKSQILPTEQPATTLQCTSPTATVNEPVGDTGVNVTSATVTVSVNCSQEVYDQQGVQTLVEGLLKAKAAADPTLAGYELVGDIVSTTKVDQVDPKTGIVTLGVTAKGMWVDQLDAKALAQLIAGLSAEQARTKLLAQPGVVSVSISVASLPSDPTKITIDIVKVPGFSGGGGTSTPVPGPGTPSSPTVQPGGG